MNSSDEIDFVDIFNHYTPRYDLIYTPKPQRYSSPTQNANSINSIKSSKVLQLSNDVPRNYRQLQSFKPQRMLPRQKNLWNLNVSWQQAKKSFQNPLKYPNKTPTGTNQKFIKKNSKFTKLNIPELKKNDRINKSIDELIYKKNNIQKIDSQSTDKVNSSNNTNRKQIFQRKKQLPLIPIRIHNGIPL